MAWTVAAQQPGQWWKSLADWMFQVAVWWWIFLMLWALSARSVRWPRCVSAWSSTDRPAAARPPGDRYLLPDQLNQISCFCVGVWNRFARLLARSLPWSDRVIVPLKRAEGAVRRP